MPQPIFPLPLIYGPIFHYHQTLAVLFALDKITFVSVLAWHNLYSFTWLLSLPIRESFPSSEIKLSLIVPQYVVLYSDKEMDAVLVFLDIQDCLICNIAVQTFEGNLSDFYEFLWGVLGSGGRLRQRNVDLQPLASLKTTVDWRNIFEFETTHSSMGFSFMAFQNFKLFDIRIEL